MEYAEAITVLGEFVANSTDPLMTNLAKISIAGAEMGLSLPDNAEGVKVENLGRKVNAAFSEYAPTLSLDGSTLYFSTWEATEVVNPEDTNDPKQLSGIFMSSKEAKKDGTTEWGKPTRLGKEVNRVNAHTANPALSADGRRLIYNRVVMQNQKTVESKIYSSDQNDEGWDSGNEVAGVNGDYLALNPTTGELFGNEVLFFISDMPGGYGGRDIYYATYNGDGTYQDPVNLGESINTPYDEDTPFYFDGTLYFSTNGRPTLGGLDVYHSDWNGSNWSKPENMGKAYNSSVDDLSFRVFDEGYAGFMTSNREGGRSVKSKTCCDDMYGFTVDRLFADLVVGVFTAETSTQKPQPLLGSTVKLTATENGLTGSPESQTKADGNQFNYGLNLENAYQVIASAEGYYPDTFTFNTLGLEESKTTVHRFFLEAVPISMDTIVIEEAIVLENILYDFDDDKILPTAEQDLEFIKGLMEQYPDMKIELSSHTDFRGENAYNLRLSQKRTDSARRWLIRNGIDGARIKAKGYGETVPQTVNTKNAARYDFMSEGDILTEPFITALSTEEQKEAAHQLNRRTEFKILEGPTSIIIDRKIIERREDGSDRKAEPTPQPAPKATPAPASKQQPAPEKVRQTSISPKSLPYQSSLSREESLAGLPVLVFGQRELQLGRVNHGEKRSFSYIFTNKGDSPAQISLITACECTTTTHDNSKVYQPGQSGVIQVSFDSTEKDESETIDIDILLKQRTKSGEPIMETVQYSYELVK